MLVFVLSEVFTGKPDIQQFEPFYKTVQICWYLVEGDTFTKTHFTETISGSLSFMWNSSIRSVRGGRQHDRERNQELGFSKSGFSGCLTL